MGILPSALYELAHHISATLQALEDTGLHVEVGDDFIKYRALRARQEDRAPVYPMFDASQSYIDATNGFWICGYDDTGALVHTQAVRLLDLDGVSLQAHLDMHRHKYITPDTTPDPDKTRFTGPAILNHISGRVAYQGDFWLRAKGLGGPRSQGATTLLSRLLLEMTQQAWTPDYVFAFVPRALAAKGAHLRYGYIHCEPGRWIGPDDQVTDEDHLIWMSAEDLAGAFARPAPRLRRTDPAIAPQDTGSKLHAL